MIPTLGLTWAISHRKVIAPVIELESAPCRHAAARSLTLPSNGFGLRLKHDDI